MLYKSKMTEKRKLEQLAEETAGSKGGGAFYHEFKQRYVRCKYLNPKIGKYARKQSNKQIRRSDEPLNYGLYRRAYDCKLKN